MQDQEKTPRDEQCEDREGLNKETSLLYQSALDYAGRKWRVLPLHRDKSPHTPNGWKDGTTDPEQIREWWEQYPDANIGIVTGVNPETGCGLLVIDIDVAHGDVDGSCTLNEWEREHGELPVTVTCNTGSGGSHYYYSYSADDQIAEASVHKCADLGVDIQIKGYVVAPPSIHEGGAPYVWECPPDEIDLAPVDDVVMSFIDYVRGDDDSSSSSDKTTSAENNSGFVLPDEIPEGKRDDTLFKYAASLHAKGTPDDVIYTSVSDANIARCKPPLTPDEAKGRAQSAIKRYQKGKTSKNTPKVGNITKIEQLFEETPYLRDALATNTFDNRLYIRSVVPWSTETNRLYDKELDFANIRRIVQDKIGTIDKESINNAVSIIGNKVQFDSVRDALELLPPWDGKEHVGHLFNKILGAKDIPYTREVETILFNGLVMRQFQPGCKFDYIPVLIGAQDLGKSRFCELLALNDEWFTDTPIDPRDREVGRYVRGRIVVEIPELSGFKGKDIESIKAFVTRRYDDFRKLYVDDVIKHPRRYVIIGTTNEDQFLRDRTGNRRFLPIYCGVHEILIPIRDTDAVTYEIRQAWAETLHKYHEGGGKLPLVLPEPAQVSAKTIQEIAMQDDPRIGKIGAWLEDKATFKADKRTCAVQIICECLGYEDNQYPNYLPTEIHTIMKAHFPEWVYSVKRVKIGDYGQQRHYEYTPPEQSEQ